MKNYQSKRQNSYSYGNLAYKLNRKYELSDERQERLSEKKKRVNKELLAFRVNLIISVLIVFCMSAVLMTQYSNLSFKQDKLQKLEQELKMVQDNLADSKLAIAEIIDTDNIEKVATETLGMVKIADYQMVNLDIPKENYTVKY